MLHPPLTEGIEVLAIYGNRSRRVLIHVHYVGRGEISISEIGDREWGSVVPNVPAICQRSHVGTSYYGRKSRPEPMSVNRTMAPLPR